MLGYFGWLSLGLSLGSALLLSSRADVRRRIRAAPRLWWRAVMGACLSSGACGLVIWAQAHGSIAVVAALRETSVVFPTLIAVCLFGEGWGARRIVAAVAVVAGLAILHVGSVMLRRAGATSVERDRPSCRDLGLRRLLWMEIGTTGGEAGFS